MKFTCAQGDLLKAVALAGRATPASGVMPVLSHVLADADSDRLRLVGTDLEVALQIEIPAQVTDPGRVVLPARLLAELAGTLPDAGVSFESLPANETRITCEASTFTLLGLPADDFPTIPQLSGTPTATLGADVLRSLIRQTAFAAASDLTRPFLTGVSLTADGSALRAAATDGGRLAVRTITLDAPAAAALSVIVPLKALRELARALAGTDAPVSIASVENQLLFATGTIRLSTRLISGKFPDYEAVIPESFPQRIRVNTDRLIHALRRTAITARDTANVIRIAADATTLRITSNTPDVGSGREDVAVTADGETVEAAFNARYLLDCLQTIDSEDVSFDLSGPLSPAVIRPTERSDQLYVIAPVRVYG